MSNKLYHSLVGRVVRVYKGGPEATVGKLLAVKEDFLVIETKKGEIIYFTLQHIKTIIEDSQSRFNSVKPLDHQVLDNLEMFQDVIQIHVGEDVRINRGGPESRVGKLLAVKGNFFMLVTKKDGLLFYNTQHVKSLTKVGMEQQEKESKNESDDNENKKESLDSGTTENLMAVFNEVAADKFHDFLKNLKYTWVKINRGGPDSIEGLLVDSSEEHLVIVVKNEVLRYPLFHVKSISFELTLDKQEDDGSNNENKDKDENKDTDTDTAKNENKDNDDNKDNNKENNKENAKGNSRSIPTLKSDGTWG